MKNILFLILVITISFQAFSQNANNQVVVDPDKNGEMEDSLLSIEEEKHNGHFAGVDFGLNVLLNNSFQANFPSDPQWNNAILNSYYFNFNFYDRKLIISPERLGVTLGLGLNLSKFALLLFLSLSF